MLLCVFDTHVDVDVASDAAIKSSLADATDVHVGSFDWGGIDAGGTGIHAGAALLHDINNTHSCGKKSTWRGHVSGAHARKH